MLERFALPSRRARVAAMAVVVLAVAVLLPVRVIAGRDSKGTLQTTAAMPLVTSTGADRSDFSYLFVDHDSNRTHGMLDTRDLSVLQRARRSVDRDFLLLRLKDRFYTVTEPQALADAAALVSQLDAYQARLAPIEAHMEVLGTQSIDGTAQLNDATVRYDELDGRVQTLRTAVAQRRARGLDVTALAAQLAAAREARDAAAALTQERERQVEELSAQQEAEQKRIDALTAELDRAHEGVLADLRAWATSAIARGVARPLG